LIEKLPPRERQVFDALYALGEASAAEIATRMADPPSNSAIRIMLSRLEKKGFITHRLADQKYVYVPALPQRKVKQSVLRQMIATFFDGSPIGAAAALIGMSEKIDPTELDALEAAIARARQEQVK
jgi:predicted transcriptional regulator